MYVMNVGHEDAQLLAAIILKGRWHQINWKSEMNENDVRKMIESF